MVDVSKFLPVYFEESAEKLAVLESGLRTLGQGLDAEVLEQTTRAVHSIKGSSGTFGFDDVCTLALAIEDLLWHVSKGQLALNSQVFATCFEATAMLGDVIRMHQDKQGVPADKLDGMVGKLKALITAGMLAD